MGLDADDVRRHLQTAEAELADLTAAANARQAELDTLSAALTAEREKLIAAEVAVCAGPANRPWPPPRTSGRGPGRKPPR
ncbi:hypothetical protein [Frigoriglobus tundricola]|uniref:Uncharacterized protein n=1 Tax=Frigoriglobus tundricola TaxID=2774151 RepID=A0A6M5YRN7_9BACT|nr:hypothetical protein [Frigoriglobus tundricola]QJW95632.1 hypothetical protein FTUN_3183 [Frigoriglobus tundricola]